MRDYKELGFDKNLRRGLAAEPRTFVSAFSDDYKTEKGPYLPPTAISKGTLLATLGGITEFRDSTGGTVIFTYDPQTGTITLNGGVIAGQTLNLGTVNNGVLSGTTTISGLLTDGTINSTGTIYNAAIGTPAVTGGTLTNTRFHNGTIGTSAMIGGTITNPTINSPVLFSPKITGVGTVVVNSGSSTLPAAGNFEFQTFGTGPVLVLNLGGTSFRWTPSGTI